jgi:MFS family permease
MERSDALGDPYSSSGFSSGKDPTDPLQESRFTQFRSSKPFLSFTVGLAVFVDLLCYGIIMPLTPFIVENLGLKSTANGALIACYAIGLLIASPVAGIISDRMANRRIPMVAGLIALLLSTVLFMEALEHFWVGGCTKDHPDWPLLLVSFCFHVVMEGTRNDSGTDPHSLENSSC